MTEAMAGARRLTAAALRPRLGAAFDKAAGLVAMALLAAAMLGPLLEAAPPAAQSRSSSRPGAGPVQPEKAAREILLAGYAGAPWYYRTDLKLQRDNGTDLTLKEMGWDGDALYFPIDGGFRSVEWWGSAGIMIDFLHNKAIARLGKGAHGRKIANGVIEEVATEGTLKGQPGPAKLKLTDLFERLEFTHGHNVLIPTAMFRLATLTRGIRPYFGIGAGVAVPHVETWFTGEDGPRTNEYQYAGPAAQVVAGLELRTGKASYFIEYKFQYAWIAAALTGDQSVSWKQSPLAGTVPRWLLEPFVGLMELPGDLYRQARRWWTGGPQPKGRISTTLAAHQVVVGAGYWWQRAAK